MVLATRKLIKVEMRRSSRVCIEINLTHLVASKVYLSRHWYKVESQGMHINCISCDYYDDVTHKCVVKAMTTSVDVHHQHEKTTQNHNETVK